MYRKSILKILAVTYFIGILGCASTGPDVKPMFAGDTAIPQSAGYTGPKAKIIVAEIEAKVAPSEGYQPQYGQEIHSMLVNRLVESGRYIVLDSSILNAGRGKKRVEKADLLVQVAMTTFNPGSVDTTNQKVGGNLINNLSFTQANVAIHVRLLDVKSRRIVAAGRFEGKGVGFGGQFTNSAQFTSLTGTPNGPMEKAVEDCIAHTLNFMNAKTPPAYFRYRG
jgi:curli biogenesis system outer membrane secretion channel CsgG